MGSFGRFMENEKSEYIVKADVDVKGTGMMFDPSCNKTVKMVD